MPTKFMSEHKKTEEQLRHDIRRKFNFSEDKDKERIDTAIEMEKDRFKAVQKKQELKAQLEEGKTDKPVGTKQDPEGKNLTAEDNIIIAKKVETDDIGRVIKWMEQNNQSAKEALGDKDLKAILAVRKEERKTAQATNTGKGKRGSSEVSDEKILEQASKGEEVDPEKLAEANLNRRMKK